jgi:hypothetical protein
VAVNKFRFEKIRSGVSPPVFLTPTSATALGVVLALDFASQASVGESGRMERPARSKDEKNYIHAWCLLSQETWQPYWNVNMQCPAEMRHFEILNTTRVLTRGDMWPALLP